MTVATKPHSKVQPKLSRGDKLICINDANLKRRYTPGPIVKGHVYCVREVFTDQGEEGVLLVGIQGPYGPDGLEQGFKISRFRWVHR